MKSLKDNIIVLPDPKLRQRSKKVGLIDEEVNRIIDLMTKSTLDWEDSRQHEVGVALAAVQIAELKRIVVIRNDFDNKKDRTFSVFINPKITKYYGELIEDYEGCLSIKDIYGKVKRYSKIKVRAQDETGAEIRVTAEGFLARIFQHEIDHTNGIVFIDHIKDDPDAFYRLDKNGQLAELDYEQEIKDSSILW